jgi:ribosomal protein S18 acetylase RimI-like enzyme
MNMSYMFDRMWVLSTEKNIVSALLFQSGKTLFPVFGSGPGEPERIILPPYIARIIQSTGIYAIQGLLRDTLIMENLLWPLGIHARARLDYDLMALDNAAALCAVKQPPPVISFRPPTTADLEALYALHTGYLNEEVKVPGDPDYEPKVCRAQTERILRREKALVACAGPQLIGKINTNAHSFSRCQLGGVYVAPGWRGHGIATAMTLCFCHALLSGGTPVSLFVRKTNPAARQVYRKVGFRKIADYSTVYME